MDDLSFEQIVAMLRKKYGAKLQNGRVQVMMLEQLLQYLKRKYPNDWVHRLQEILAAAFPDRAAQLFDLSKNLYRYQKTNEDMRSKLASMSPDERRKALWEMRKSIFGEEAADEIFAAQKRNEQILGAIETIRNSPNMNIQDKLDHFAKEIKNAYGDQSEKILEKRRMEFTTSFLQSVQGDLEKMSDTDRRSSYRSLWQQMGYDNDAVDRLDSLENLRDQRWSDGGKYMKEREEIVGKYSGSERESRLNDLRKSYFKDEADTIREEENAGFFRYSQKRQYGLN